MPSSSEEMANTQPKPNVLSAFGVKIWVITVANMNTPVESPAREARWPASITAVGTTGSNNAHAAKAEATATSTGIRPRARHTLVSDSTSPRVSGLDHAISHHLHKREGCEEQGHDS